MAAETLRAEGIVHSVRPGPDGSVAVVSLQAPAACPRCAEGRGCGAGLFGRRSRNGFVDVPVPDGVILQPGDEINLVLGERGLLRASMLVYGLPLAGSLLACAAAWFASAGDGVAVLAALCGLAGGLIVARRRLRRTTGQCPVDLQSTGDRCAYLPE